MNMKVRNCENILIDTDKLKYLLTCSYIHARTKYSDIVIFLFRTKNLEKILFSSFYYVHYVDFSYLTISPTIPH